MVKKIYIWPKQRKYPLPQNIVQALSIGGNRIRTLEAVVFYGTQTNRVADAGKVLMAHAGWGGTWAWLLLGSDVYVCF